MNNILETVLFVVYWSGFLLTLWAGAEDRFRLKPYGLPRPISSVFRQSIVDTFLTFFWFVSVPSWFVYRWVRRTKRTHDQP